MIEIGIVGDDPEPLDSKKKPPLERIDARIDAIKPRQESNNGNMYTMLVLPDSTRIFVWDEHWREEIEQHLENYLYLDATLYVRDESNDPDDTFYCLEAVAPADPDTAWQFLDRHQQQAEARRS